MSPFNGIRKFSSYAIALLAALPGLAGRAEADSSLDAFQATGSNSYYDRTARIRVELPKKIRQETANASSPQERDAIAKRLTDAAYEDANKDYQQQTLQMNLTLKKAMARAYRLGSDTNRVLTPERLSLGGLSKNYEKEVKDMLRKGNEQFKKTGHRVGAVSGGKLASGKGVDPRSMKKGASASGKTAKAPSEPLVVKPGGADSVTFSGAGAPKTPEKKPEGLNAGGADKVEF